MARALHLSAFLLVLLASMATISAVAETRYDTSPRERALLNDWSGFLAAPLQDGDVADLERLLDTPDQAVGTFAATLLFRHDPARFREAMFDKLAVRDYDLRSQGIETIVSQEDFLRAIDALEKAEPTINDNRMVMLIVFLHFRDANEWFMNRGQKVALARVFRTAFLTSILAGSTVDPLETANAIDRWTQAEMDY